MFAPVTIEDDPGGGDHVPTDRPFVDLLTGDDAGVAGVGDGQTSRRPRTVTTGLAFAVERHARPLRRPGVWMMGGHHD